MTKRSATRWAVTQTGVDPEKLAADATTTPPASGAGGGLEGAGSAPRGEPCRVMPARERSGASASGASSGAVRARRQMEEQHQTATQSHEQRQTQLQRYDRAYTACLTGRGYTVQ